MIWTKSLFMLVIAVSLEVDANPNGAPTSACATLTPQHGGWPQVSASPYTLTTTSPQAAPGDKVSVTVSSKTGSSTFKGFIMQARSTKTNQPIGMFTTIPSNAQTLKCSGAADTVTHNSADLKKSVTFQWQAPGNVNDTVVFTATMVEDFSTFYMNVKSPSVQIAKKASVTAKPAVSAAKSSASSAKPAASSAKSSASSAKSSASSAKPSASSAKPAASSAKPAATTSTAS